MTNDVTSRDVLFAIFSSSHLPKRWDLSTPQTRLCNWRVAARTCVGLQLEKSFRKVGKGHDRQSYQINVFFVCVCVFCLFFDFVCLFFFSFFFFMLVWYLLFISWFLNFFSRNEEGSFWWTASTTTTTTIWDNHLFLITLRFCDVCFIWFFCGMTAVKWCRIHQIHTTASNIFRRLYWDVLLYIV